MENFAKRLAQLRKEKGYTQSELADKIGVSNKSVSRWISGYQCVGGFGRCTGCQCGCIVKG